MKILNDDGPLRIEDHEDRIKVVHKAGGQTLLDEPYPPGNIHAWTLAFGLARGFQRGWSARKGFFDGT